MKSIFILLLNFCLWASCLFGKGLPLYYWQPNNFDNFGDILSIKLVERIVKQPVQYSSNPYEKKLFAIGSILRMARDNDVIWGTGLNFKASDLREFKFKKLDVRAVRGPLTRKFLWENFHIDSPEIYGDPALLVPKLFPELKKNKAPQFEYIIIPHYSESHLFPKSKYPNVVYTTEPWDVVIKKILNSKFVISSSLHGIIVAESYGIPARLLKIDGRPPSFKYIDYYLGTGREQPIAAKTIEEALQLGGESPMKCDLEKLYNAFPFEFWENR